MNVWFATNCPCYKNSLLVWQFASVEIILEGNVEKKTKFRLRNLMKFTWQTTKVTFLFSYYLQLLYNLCSKETSNNVFSLSNFGILSMWDKHVSMFWFVFFHFVRFHLHKALYKSKEFPLKYFICYIYFQSLFFF